MSKTYKNFKLVAETNEPKFLDKVILAEITRVETTRVYGNWFFGKFKEITTEKTFQVIKCKGWESFLEVATSDYISEPKDFYFIYESLEHLNKQIDKTPQQSWFN